MLCNTNTTTSANGAVRPAERATAKPRHPIYAEITIRNIKAGFLTVLDSVPGEERHQWWIGCDAKHLTTFRSFRGFVGKHSKTWIHHSSQDFAKPRDRAEAWDAAVIAALKRGQAEEAFEREFCQDD